MTGDGVNDILALKTADCSIAMESGNDTTKEDGAKWLLDSDFGRGVPSIVAEGRRVVNNIQRSSQSLFDQEYLFYFVSYLSDALSLYLSHHAVADVFDPVVLRLSVPGFFLARPGPIARAHQRRFYRNGL